MLVLRVTKYLFGILSPSVLLLYLTVILCTPDAPGLVFDPIEQAEARTDMTVKS